MDLMEIFAPVAQFFVRICAVKIPIAGYDVPAGAFFVYAGLLSIVGWFFRHYSD